MNLACVMCVCFVFCVASDKLISVPSAIEDCNPSPTKFKIILDAGRLDACAHTLLQLCWKRGLYCHSECILNRTVLLLLLCMSKAYTSVFAETHIC